MRLKKVTPRDLGLSSIATIEKIHEAAEKKGLKLCPPWVGPQYRMECKDDEYTMIGMEPMTAPDGAAGIFRVHRDDRGRWLLSFHAGNRWLPGYEFLFVSSQDSS